MSTPVFVPKASAALPYNIDPADLDNALNAIPFLQSGTGAVATDLQTRGRLVVYAQDFMTAAQKSAVSAGDYSQDVTAALQGAIDEVHGLGGGVVRLPRGGYLVSQNSSSGYCLNIYGNVYLVGDGKYLTTIKMADSQNSHVIYGNALQYLYFQGFTVDGNKAGQTSGDDHRGIYIVSSSDIEFNHVIVKNASDHGFFTSTSGNRTLFHACEAYSNGSDGNPGGTGFATNGGDIEYSGKCISMSNVLAGYKDTGSIVKHFGSYAEANGSEGFSVGFDVSTPGVDHSYIGCMSTLNGADGFRFASQVTRISVIGCVGRTNNWSGLCSLNATKDLQIVGCQFRDNGQNFVENSTTRGNGIALIDSNDSTPTTRAAISGGTICEDTQGSPTQVYGISIENATDNVTVSGDTILINNKNGPMKCTTSSLNVKLLSGITGLSTETNDYTTHTVTGTTSETDMASTTISAYEMPKNSILHIEAFGNITGTAGTKVVKLYIGGTAFTVISESAAQTADWWIKATIQSYSYANQRVVVRGGYLATTSPYTGVTSLVFDTTSSAIIKLSGTLGNSGDSIIQRGFILSRER